LLLITMNTQGLGKFFYSGNFISSGRTISCFRIVGVP